MVWVEMGSGELLVAWFMVLAIIGFWVVGVGVVVFVFLGLVYGWCLLGLAQYTFGRGAGCGRISASCCSSC